MPCIKAFVEGHEVLFGEVVDEKEMKERLGDVLFVFGSSNISFFVCQTF